MKERERLEKRVVSELLYHKGDYSKGKKAYDKFRKEQVKSQQINLFKKVVKYAAVVAIALFANNSIQDYIAIEPICELSNKLHIPASQRILFELPDGTSVWLNSQTTLSYPSTFASNERRVKIEGEAYFDVVKDNNRPFIVEADNIDIKVLGTKFNVTNYPFDKAVTTSLIEGSVEVTNRSTPNKSIILEPNQQVVIDKNGSRVEDIPYMDYFTWIDGIYAFQNEKLSDIIERLELYYDIKIKIQDKSKFETRYTGKFRHNDGIQVILNIINQMHDFEICYDRENNIITLI